MKYVYIILSFVSLYALTACSKQSIWKTSQSQYNSVSSTATENNETIVIIMMGVQSRLPVPLRLPGQMDTLLSLTIKRKNYQPLPIGAHIDTLVYNQDGEIIESLTMSIRSHNFHRSVNGSYRPAPVNEHISSDCLKGGLIEVYAYSRRHEDHTLIAMPRNRLFKNARNI